MNGPSPRPAAPRTATPGWPRAALLSLSDKSGAVAFARALAGGGTRLLASDGTAAHLREAGVEVTAVEQWTGFPEMLGGRVKTLHPHVHAPILARRDRPEDLAALAARGLEPIDLVAVTLYPFEERAAPLEDAGMIEEIDIGGVALLRAAAKNHEGVIVVHDVAQYTEVLESLARGVTAEDRRRWALGGFTRTARYDGAIAAELARRLGPPGEPPATHALVLERARTLRYGENPHQVAALYARGGTLHELSAWREGKELSYNNLLDLEAAVSLVWRFERPACVIVKHNQPCGVACADTLEDAYSLARDADSLSSFGGIVAFNRTLDEATARALHDQFVECIAFPGIEPAADAALRGKKNARLLRLTAADLACADPWAVRLVGPWALLQRGEPGAPPPWRTVTRRAPDREESESLRFAWEVCAAARSNAVVLARGEELIGLGSGQTSRVDAVDVALMKARRAGHDVHGVVLASDGFFPFADSVTHAAEAGILAIVQPGGSVRDAEVIAEADRLGVAMVFTDRRTFRH
ncbi:MAG: bifunctional phosphoribosylaminoimidazolecarboxamide formyltransferase/IMP cyclohydrolase [Candidatus Eisenbacteria bacterium]|nr:bifunctional phosphoribosylaminoimidazolecarboxamide formyltransferase/IMP cyclohydrolase [Candidatus Eisenbacteria bacterium]